MLSIASSSLRVATKPHIGPVTITSGPTGQASFTLNRHIDAVGSVTLAGKPGDSTAGWQIGFLQVEWVETNWALYRGAQSSDGSSLVQRGRSPARPMQACMDNGKPGAPFYGDPTDAPYAPTGETQQLADVVALPPNPSFPLTVKVYHYDKPADGFGLVRTNTRTGKPNLLRAAQLEFLFCAMLVARTPGGQYQYLKGFYWNTRWQNEFKVVQGTIVALPVAGGSGCGVGAVFDGKPNDRRFRSVLNNPQHTNCNNVAAYASNHPNVREAVQWHDFDVRR